MNVTEVVWFKRDLRVEDHEPLARACESGNAVLALYVVEKDYYELPDVSARHLRFIWDCLEALHSELAKRSIPLRVVVGEVTSVLEELRTRSASIRLWSHEETGNLWTYARDRKVGAWCRERGVEWHEFRQFGVIRGRCDRDRWAGSWESFMSKRGPLPAPRVASGARTARIQPLPPFARVRDELSLPNVPEQGAETADQQRGGVPLAQELLRSFLDHRAAPYREGMGSPIQGESVCSRLSPHLAYGSISLRTVLHATRERRAQLHPTTKLFRSLESFESRLHWHCHFIQKLESEPELERRNFNRAFDGMRESEWNEGHFQAWCRGQTGIPMIDACMRSLHATGWINFRMRAMLMSFASYQLWLHWEKPARHLARLFTDYEPGIHFSQAQMQSGVTGINTIRIYSPEKQALDQDPEGVFIARWIPELSRIPPAYRHAPYEMPPLLMGAYGLELGRDYPEPIVDPAASYQRAKERAFAWHARPEVRAEARRVYQRHGSRRRSGERRPSGSRD